MKKGKIIGIIISFIAAILLFFILMMNFCLAPQIKNITIHHKDVAQDVLEVELQRDLFRFHKEYYCKLSETEEVSDDGDWIKAEDHHCTFSVNNGTYYAFVKDHHGNISSSTSQLVSMDKVLELHVTGSKKYLALDDTLELKATLAVIGKPDTRITWESSDEEVATVNDGVVTPKKTGTVTISAMAQNNKKVETEIMITDFIRKMVIDNKKEYLPCHAYSEEEAHILDDILASRIQEAGPAGSRASVLAAIRFLTLEFPYQIKYFYETGRLNTHDVHPYVDGEGRYFHKGLYLSDDKMSDIAASMVGPAIWGCPLKNLVDHGSYYPGKMTANGLDCSGFLSWALLNAGVPNTKDSGAGYDPDADDAYSDYGEHIPLDEKGIYESGVRPGDLIGIDGHIAMIAGMDEEHFYIAESLVKTRGPRISIYTKKELLTTKDFTYMIKMDDHYTLDGQYTDLW